MNGVIGMLSLLEKTPLSGEQRHYINVISQSGNALLLLLNDVLELSRIEAGKLEIRPEPTDVRTLVAQVTELFRPAAEAKGLLILAEWPGSVPEWYALDGPRVRQILLNLVGNAVKFTDFGEVEITVSPSSPGPDCAELIFAVRDTGIGISADQIPRLFQKFSQADGSYARRYGGSGLGLSICDGLARCMHGRIEVDSQPGAGSTFRLILPVRRAGPVPQASRPVVEGPSARLHVLVAEDNLINVKVTTGMLKRLGHDCTISSNGREAVEAVRTASIDLVLMDCQMPEMDGFAATAAIRALPAAIRQPVIIAMTANAMAGDRERCLAAGMDDYLAKPLLMEDLDACLRRWAARLLLAQGDRLA
jgi:CheY-like chemotaxis protein